MRCSSARSRTPRQTAGFRNAAPAFVGVRASQDADAYFHFTSRAALIRRTRALSNAHGGRASCLAPCTTSLDGVDSLRQQGIGKQEKEKKERRDTIKANPSAGVRSLGAC